jgi:hypothetical protein
MKLKNDRTKSKGPNLAYLAKARLKDRAFDKNGKPTKKKQKIDLALEIRKQREELKDK